MCNLSKGVYESGKEQGKEQQARETAISLKKLGMLSLQQIADAVGFDLSTVEKWLTPVAAN